MVSVLLSHLTAVDPSKPTFNSDRFAFKPKLFVVLPFESEPEIPILSSHMLISNVNFAMFIFIPADDDLIGCSALPLA